MGDNTNLELDVAEEPAASVAGDHENFRFPEMLLILAKRKSFILKLVGAIAILAIAVSLLLKNTYTATTKILPPQQNQSISSSALMSQLGPLAMLAGQGLGLRNPSDIYVGMLHSDTVADAIVEHFSLMSVYKKKLRVDARRTLGEHTVIVAAKDNIISISVEDKDPGLAADLANAYVDELENLTKILAVTEAGKRRAFFERETNMAMDDLARAEEALKKTQKETGLILLDPQSRAMIDSVSSLRARVSAQEVVVQSMQSFATEDNPDLVRAKSELAALRAQVAKLEGGGGGKRSFDDVPIENIPEAGLEYYRKLREVRYRETLFELLAKQYEAAKIDEARDALIVQQLDRALRPEKKSGPVRSVIVLSATVLGLLVACALAFAMEKLAQAQADPQFSARLQLFRSYLSYRKL